MQKRTLLNDPSKIKHAVNRYPANFVAYDILYYRDHLITELPLMERKDILSSVVNENDLISVSRYIEKDDISLFDFVKKKKKQLEGIVGKKKR